MSEIKKLAQKAANATDKTEQDAISRQLLQLRAEYLSEVAPDRKQLYQQAKSAMKNQNANPKCKVIGELTLLDFLEMCIRDSMNYALDGYKVKASRFLLKDNLADTIEECMDDLIAEINKNRRIQMCIRDSGWSNCPSYN